MLLISLMIMCLSPFTAITVHSISIPKITTFEFFIDDYYTNGKPNKRIHLRCNSSSQPPTKITFYKNGIEVRDNDSRIQRVDNHNILINNASHGVDDGVYRCTASNQNGEISKELAIKMTTIGEFERGSQVQDPPETIEVVIGRSKSIYCPKHSYSYPLKYKWVTRHRRFEFIKQNRRVHFLGGGKILFFSFVTKEDVDNINDKGGVSCVLQTDGSLKLSKKFKLKVTGQESIGDRQPSFVEELPAKQHVLEGENLDLKCAASGNPIPRLKWYRNGVEININDSSRYEINTLLPERLTLLNVRADMEGEYKCEFQNRAGKIDSRGRVHVARPPKIKKQLPQSVERVLKTEFVLECDAEGTGPIDYKWIRNGSQLTTFHSEKGSVIVEDGLIKITNVSYEDQGVYQCIVRSIYGQDFTVTKLIVKQPTGGMTGNESSSNINRSNTTFEEEKEDDNPLELKYIILIACGGTIFLVLTCGAVFMYCRTKKDNRQEQFIPTPRPGYNDYHRQSDPIYAKPDFSTQSTSFHESDEDVTSTFSGAKMNDPAFLSLMDKLREDQSTAPSENFYYDVSDGKQSITPSTEL